MIASKRYMLVVLHKCKYICKIKRKTTKILKFVKTLLTIKTLKIYKSFQFQGQLDHAVSIFQSLLLSYTHTHIYIYILYIYVYMYIYIYIYTYKFFKFFSFFWPEVKNTSILRLVQKLLQQIY